MMPRDPATRQIWLINLSHLACHYALLILATAVLVMAVREAGRFGDAYGPILALGTGMFVLYGALALPMDWCVRRFGRRAMMAAHGLGTGTGLLLAGMATGPWTLAAALALMGAFNAIYHPVGTALLVEVAGDRVGRAVGNNGVFGNLGVALAPVATMAMAVGLGWRWAFWLPALPMLALGWLWLRTPVAGAGAGGRRAAPFPEIPAPVVRQAVVSLLLLAAVSGFVFNAFTLLVPKLIAERLAASPSLLPLVGALAFAATLCGGLTQFSVGRMIDRTTLRRAFLPLALALVPALAALSWLEGWAVLPVAGLAAAAIFGQVTVNEAMTARYIAPTLRVRMYGIRFFVGFLGAALASPAIAALHGWSGDLRLAMLVLAGCGAVTLGVALLFPDREEELPPERRRRAVPPMPVAAE